MSDNRPLSEQFRLAAEDWRDKEAAAALLEQTKSAWVARKERELGDIPVARAEQIVRASEWYMDYIRHASRARAEANAAWVEVETIKMQFQEWQSAAADRRKELGM